MIFKKIILIESEEKFRSIFESLQEVFGEESPSYATVKRWSADFTSGMQKSFEDEFYKIFKEVQKEEGPSADTIWDHTFVNNENADWRAF